MDAAQTLRLAYTPDSDDAFTYWAWEQGLVGLEGYETVFERAPIGALNQAAAAGQYDVVAVSSAFYPRVADAYAILTVGNSIGRNCGPVLVSKRFGSIEELAGRSIGVGGHPTTGSCLAAMFVPEARLVVHPFERIIDAVASGELDAGVMIHEEIVAYEEAGLRCVRDLGDAWGQQTSLPLPVGLNLVRKELGQPTMRAIASACERSLLWGLEHPDKALLHAEGFGRGRAREHLAMFKHSDSLRMPEDARRGVQEMIARVAALGLGPADIVPSFIEGTHDATALAAHGAD